MAITEKTLSIKITGDTTDAQGALAKVNAALTATGVTAKNVTSILDNTTGKFSHDIELASDKLNKLKNASSSILGSTNIPADKLQPSSKITQNLQEEAAARRAASASIYKQETQQALSALDNRLNLERAERVHGAQSIQAIEIRAAQQEQAIRQRLADDILNIERRLRDGTIANRGAANASRQALVSQSSAQITANRITLEAAQATERHRVALEQASNAQQSFAARVLEGISLYRLYSFVITNVSNAIKSIPNVGIELDATRSSLIATIGGTVGAAGALKFLDEEAQRTGISVSTLRQTFRTFQASTSLAGESLQTTTNIFRDINTVATALHLTADKTSSVFLALSQIFNKSKVQSEELVKQLGNLLPGAFASFAKANEGLFKNTADLISKMKLGVVTAHDTVEKFAAYLANRFKDSFEAASQTLNANIGRMQTSFIHLSEAIYGKTSGALVTITRNLASLGDYLTESVKGTTGLSKVFDAFSIIARSIGTLILPALTVSFGALLGILASYISSVGIATIATNALATAMKFSPAALLGGLTLVITKYHELAGAATDAENAIDAAAKRAASRQKADTKEKKIDFQVSEDPLVQEAQARLDFIDKRVAKLKGSGNAFGVFDNTYIKQEEARSFNAAIELQRRKENAKVKIEAQSLGENAQLIEETEQARYDVHISYLERTKTADAQAEAASLKFERQHAKTRNSLLNAEAAGKKPGATPEQIEQSKKDTILLIELEKAKQLAIQDARDLYNKKGLSALNKQNAAIRKESRDLYSDLNRDSTNNSKVIQDSLKDLDHDYKLNLVSLSSYFDKKKQLQLKDLETQLLAADESKGIATQTGDIAKANEFQDKIQNLIRQTQEVQAEVDREKFDALTAYNLKLDEIHSNALTSSGDVEQGSVIKIKAKYLKDEELLRANNATQALKELELTKQQEIAQSKIVPLLTKESNAATILSDREASIQRRRTIGAISEQEAFKELIAAKLELVRIEDALIDRLEKEAKIQGGDTTKVKTQLEQAKSRRDAKIQEGAGIGQQILNQGVSNTPLGSDLNNLVSIKNSKSLLSAQIELEQKAAADRLKLAGATEEEIGKTKQDISDKYATASVSSNVQLYKGIGNIASTALQGVYETSVKLYGAQSKQAKEAFLAHKAVAVAQAIINTALGVTQALAQGGIVGIATGALVAAAGAVSIASIISEPLPQAHAGLTDAPSNQTFNISKGERVVAPQQNKDLTKALADGNVGKQQSQPQNIRIINAVDPSLFNEYLGSDDGERVIMNIVKRNNG